jgi:hypothetical protein
VDFRPSEPRAIPNRRCRHRYPFDALIVSPIQQDTAEQMSSVLAGKGDVPLASNLALRSRFAVQRFGYGNIVARSPCLCPRDPADQKFSRRKLERQKKAGARP